MGEKSSLVSNLTLGKKQTYVALELVNDVDHENDLKADRNGTCLSQFFYTYSKSIILGGLDGLFMIISLIAACYGGKLSYQAIFIVGFGSLLANAIAVGVVEFLSSTAHRKFVQEERRRCMWEFKNHKDLEMKEMISLFESRGMSVSDATDVVSKMAKYEKFFINLRVSEEIGIQLPDDGDAVLIADSFIMVFSFSLFGMLPLLFYFLESILVKVEINIEVCVFSSIILLLFLLGGSRSSFTTTVSFSYCGFESAALGAVCAFVSYGVGTLISSL